MRTIAESHSLIVSVGTGGVGKTTVSAAVSVAAAMYGKRVLVVTIDPSKRLKTALQLSENGGIQKIALSGARGELYASVLDPKQVFDDFIKRNTSVTLSKRIFANKLYQNISSLLAGSQEFTSLEYVLEAHESKKYDLIVLDTPPAQHSIDFLRAPQKFYHLFDEKVVSWFQNRADGGLLAKVIGSGTKRATAVLEKLVGKGFLGEMFDFFSLIGSLAPVIQERSIKAQNLLGHSDSAFCLISSYDPIKTQEAKDLYRLLKRDGYSLKAVIMNRAFPFLSNTADLPDDLKHIYSDLSQRFIEQKRLQENMRQEIASDVDYVSIAEQNIDISSLDGLKTLGEAIFV